MRGRADAGMAVGDLGFLRANPVEKLFDVLGRKSGLGHQRHRHVGDAADMVEIIHDVIFEIFIEGRRGGLRDVPDRDGVAIGRGLGDARHGDRAARAAEVLDDHGLAERPAHGFRDKARNGVGRAAGRCRDDQRNRLRRKGALR